MNRSSTLWRHSDVINKKWRHHGLKPVTRRVIWKCAGGSEIVQERSEMVREGDQGKFIKPPRGFLFFFTHSLTERKIGISCKTAVLFSFSQIHAGISSFSHITQKNDQSRTQMWGASLTCWGLGRPYISNNTSTESISFLGLLFFLGRLFLGWLFHR